MATDVESLILRMSADLRKFEKEMGRSREIADRRLNEVERRAIQADRNLTRIMGQAGANMTGALQRSLASIAPTLAAAFSAQQVIRYADSYTSLQNRLRAAGLEGAELKRVEDALYETANRNGLQVQATAELYQRASLSRQRLGASEADLLALVSGTAAALRVQGTSAEAASGPLLQLGQALSGNKVQAEEYNSLIDGLPIVLQAAAKGSARFGGDVAKLTEQVKAGKVTSQEFFQALLAGFPAIEAQAAGSAQTVGGAFQTLDNELGRFIGQTDEGLSASQRMAEGILLLSRHLDTVTLAVSIAATVMGTRFVLAMTQGSGAMLAAGVASVRLAAFQTAMTASMTGATRAQLLATGATRAFSAALLANPIGAVIIAVSALSAALVYLSDRYDAAKVAQRELNTTVSAADEALADYERALADAATKSGEAREEALRHAEALRIVAREAIAAARALAEERIAGTKAATQRADEANRRERRTARQSRTGSGGTPGVNVLQSGNALAAANAERDVRLAREAEAAAIRERDRLEAREKYILGGGGLPAAAPIQTRASSGAGGGRDRESRSAGPTPEELARTREQLQLQGELDLARAKGDDKAVTAAQRRLDILNLTEQFERAQIANAEALATAQIDGILNAEAFADLQKRAAEGQKDFADRLRESDERRRDAQLDQIGFAAELARLEGDPNRIQQAERTLYIEERVTQLMREQVGLSEAQARAQATGEADALAAAGRTGDLREEFRSAFTDGIRAAIDGDLGGLFDSLADRFTSRMLDTLADDLFDLLQGAMKGGGGGLGSILSTVFGGFRASGGPVTAGRAYVVGERRPEVFVPSVAGSIIPSVNAAMARVQDQGGRMMQQHFYVDARGSVLANDLMAELDARSGAAALKAGMAAVATSRADMARAGRRQAQRFA